MKFYPLIRPAIDQDLPAIVELKEKMFIEAGLSHLLPESFQQKVLSCYQEMYQEKTAQHFIIEQQGEISACTGGFLKDDLPYCFFLIPQYGFIGDVYTVPIFRRQGFARSLIQTTIDWLQGRKVSTIRLLSTPNAVNLYANFGFQFSDEMILNLPVIKCS